jgi:hypothetical protein
MRSTLSAFATGRHGVHPESFVMAITKMSVWVPSVSWFTVARGSIWHVLRVMRAWSRIQNEGAVL